MSANLTEERRRVEAKLRRAIARNMSDAKWLALFAALRSAGATELYWKFVGDERVYRQRVPRETELLPDRFGDVLPAPYAAFREIEWLEIPRQQAAVASLLLRSEKAFPWQESEEGLRVVAYEW